MTTSSSAIPINEALKKMHTPISVDVEETEDALGSFKVFTMLTSEERRDSFTYKGNSKLSPSSIPISGSVTRGAPPKHL
eukprot:CAMPEP_0116008782 /NCGR_PEP_ID=MMETSP0321-20121206/3058_1 /TAXON_ID=163516 /ORGANISM="Leptocylindrus danicus var. danicus, Strain B650" /LENGTH=78 /DNA_ID=CAMNT_0003477651 /DNA_START=46 /DNA_END=282 /DNA_ORIENTATION=+